MRTIQLWICIIGVSALALFNLVGGFLPLYYKPPMANIGGEVISVFEEQGRPDDTFVTVPVQQWQKNSQRLVEPGQRVVVFVFKGYKDIERREWARITLGILGATGALSLVMRLYGKRSSSRPTP